jgi:hypothetical protein
VIVFERYARLLLVVHTISAAALVASTTHLVVWLRDYWRGRYGRTRAVRRFATICAVLYVVTFSLGNLIYPTYKVRVRAQYLDNPIAIADDHASRETARQSTEPLFDPTVDPAVPHAEPDTTRGRRYARWFDVKEHWVALGMIVALALAVLIRVYDPRRHGDALARMIVGFAVMSALCAWIGAIVGVLVTSFRSVGSL